MKTRTEGTNKLFQGLASIWVCWSLCPQGAAHGDPRAFPGGQRGCGCLPGGGNALDDDDDDDGDDGGGGDGVGDDDDIDSYAFIKSITAT